MENERWLEIECFHRVADSELKKLKVAALNLFHPTTSSLLRMEVFLYYDTVSRGRGEG
jgi:hypothetical protein